MRLLLRNARALTTGLCLGMSAASYAQSNHTLTTPGGSFGYSVDGGPATNTIISMQVGSTNKLTISTSSIHPVVITTNTSAAGRYPAAAPQNISSGTIMVTIPSSTLLTNLFYVCSVHGFFGKINIVAAPVAPPPPNQLLSINIGSNIVMTSTGTNTTWLFVPEFSSNLLTGLWAPVPNFTNTFANGTNVTTFNRLDPICGPNVFLRVRQQKN